jgi:hypothetical protein
MTTTNPTSPTPSTPVPTASLKSVAAPVGALLEWAFDVATDDEKMQAIEPSLGVYHFTVASSSPKAKISSGRVAAIREETMEVCEHGLAKLLGGISASEIRQRLIHFGKDKPASPNAAAAALDVRKRVAEIATHACLATATSEAVPAWATTSGITYAATATDEQTAEGVAPQQQSTFATRLASKIRIGPPPVFALAPLTESELETLVDEIQARKASGHTIFGLEMDLIGLCQTASVDNIEAAAVLGAKIRKAQVVPPKPSGPQDRGTATGGAQDADHIGAIASTDAELRITDVTHPFRAAERNVAALHAKALGDLTNAQALAEWQTASANLATLKAGQKRPRSSSLDGGLPPPKAAATGATVTVVPAPSYRDQGDIEWDAAVQKHRQSEMQRLAGLGLLTGQGSLIAIGDHFEQDRQLLPREVGKKVLKGKLDINLASCVGAVSSEDGGFGPGRKAMRDVDLGYFAWRDGFRRLANTMVLRWPQLRGPLDKYMEYIRLLSEQYRLSHPQGFAYYDVEYRRMASAIFTSAGAHLDFGPHEVTRSRVFATARVSLCARCGAVDHYAGECDATRQRGVAPEAGGGGSHGSGGARRGARGNDNGGQTGTGTDTSTSKGSGGSDGPNKGGSGDRKATCHKFNRSSGCDRAECRFAHECNKCQASQHGASSCPASA